MSNSAAPFDSNGTGGAYSASQAAVDSNTNFAQPADLFAAGYMNTPKGAFGGTVSNVQAAEGNYVNRKYMTGGKLTRRYAKKSGTRKPRHTRKAGKSRKMNKASRVKRGKKQGKSRARKPSARKSRGRRSRGRRPRGKKSGKRGMKRPSRKSRKMRGGTDAFINKPLSFSYGAPAMRLSPDMSALANPVPIAATDTCAKDM
jgi:hypothetical protein